MSNEHGHSQHPENYERQDTNLVTLTITVIVSVVVVVVATVFLYDYFIATKEAVIFEQQLAPVSVELEQLRANEAEILNSYGIVDSASGVYRIPIDSAMKLLVEESIEESGTGSAK